MSNDQAPYEIVGDTEIVFSGETLTEHELEELEANNVVTRYRTNNYEVERLELDGEQLSKLAFEYGILESIASTVEVEVMRVFMDDNTSNKLTTGEVTDYVKKPQSSVSRALSRLVEKGQITKIQRGVYTYP